MGDAADDAYNSAFADEYEDTFEDGPLCPHCTGMGTVDCLCAGDFCICDNHGDASCPVCHGEQYVTQERFDQYMEEKHKHAVMAREIWAGKP